MLSNSNCRRYWRSLIAPTAIFVWVLHMKTTAQTLVGATERIARAYGNYSKKTIKDGIQAILYLIFGISPLISHPHRAALFAFSKTTDG